MMDALKQGNYRLIDRSEAKTPEEQREIYARTVMSDYYFMSSNAITYEGELVNFDGKREPGGLPDSRPQARDAHCGDE